MSVIYLFINLHIPILYCTKDWFGIRVRRIAMTTGRYQTDIATTQINLWFVNVHIWSIIQTDIATTQINLWFVNLHIWSIIQTYAVASAQFLRGYWDRVNSPRSQSSESFRSFQKYAWLKDKKKNLSSCWQLNVLTLIFKLDSNKCWPELP